MPEHAPRGEACGADIPAAWPWPFAMGAPPAAGRAPGQEFPPPPPAAAAPHRNLRVARPAPLGSHRGLRGHDQEEVGLGYGVIPRPCCWGSLL